MSYSTNGIVYEAIQRTFRNAIVELLRERLTSTYDDAAERVAKCFPTWPEIKAAAARSSSTGVVAHPHEDEFAYLDVSHFTALFNNEFSVLVSVDGLPVEVIDDFKRQLIGYLREIKTIRDPVSHPGDADLDPFDALRAIDNAVRVTRILNLPNVLETLSEARAEVALLAADAPVASLTSAPVPAGLPPRDSVVVDFIGRRAELARLWEWALDPQARRWLLTGDGGKGKSAIAYQFAVEVANNAEIGFAAVHWLSAKRRRFSEGDVLPVSEPDFWDLESAVDRLLAEFGWSEHLTKPLDAKRLLLCQLVREFSCFLVIDDIDSLEEEQEDAIEFLISDLPAAGARVLLTSRRNILGMGKSSTTVAGLTEDEADEFISSRLLLFGIDPASIRAKQRRRIVALCEASPLYMEDLLRLATFLPIGQAIDSWKDNAGAKVRQYALQRELEMLSGTARSVLEVGSLVGAPVTTLELQHVLGRDEDVVVGALAELRRHHLVPAPELVEDVPRFSVNTNLRLLVLGTLQGTERLRALQTAVAAVTGGDLLAKSSRVIEDYRRQAEVFLRARQFARAEETLRNGLVVHPNHPQLFAALGSVYARSRPRRVADARAAWQRAFELGSTEWRMFLSWAQLEEHEKEWQLMIEVAERGLERLQRDDPALLQYAGYGASRLAQGLLTSFNATRAYQEFERSDDFLYSAIRAGKRDGVDPRFVSRSYRAWIINAQVRRNDSEVCRRLMHWLAWNPEDPTALEEAERQRWRCREVETFLAATEAASGT